MSGASAPRPALYGDRRRWGLLEADSLKFLPLLPERSVDAVITDPPYGFGWQQWERGTLATSDGFADWTTGWARELKRVLRPGGYLAAFGAPRTMHRLVAGVEAAGLEIRDQILWLYGSGVPKGPRLLGDRSTTLKPAYEPVLLARAPLEGNTRQNVEAWGTGALDIGATRVRDEVRDPIPIGTVLQRWPANLGLLHSLGCSRASCAGECAVRQIDDRTGKDVARFFYAAKASRDEREAGLRDCAPTKSGIFSQDRLTPRANTHPTVKPLAVMRWLVRLLAPHYGVVLDPFSGSGSTGCAALLEGRQFVGVEREKSYAEIARRRLAYWASQP